MFKRLLSLSRLLIIGLVLTACTPQTQVQSHTLKELCPAFDKPNWQFEKKLDAPLSLLIDKQKFAVTEYHRTFWFSGENQFVGLCILPVKSGLPGCHTAYATYQKEHDEWILKEQKVTICPS